MSKLYITLLYIDILQSYLQPIAIAFQCVLRPLFCLLLKQDGYRLDIDIQMVVLAIEILCTYHNGEGPVNERISLTWYRSVTE